MYIYILRNLQILDKISTPSSLGIVCAVLVGEYDGCCSSGEYRNAGDEMQAVITGSVKFHYLTIVFSFIAGDSRGMLSCSASLYLLFLFKPPTVPQTLESLPTRHSVPSHPQSPPPST